MNRDFVLTVLATLLFMLSFTAFYLLPLIVQRLGGDEADIGFVSGAGWAASVICTPFLGIWVDRWGRKVFLLAGAALLTAGALGFLLVRGIGPLIYFLRILQGVGLATGLTAGYALVADLSPAFRRGEAYGVYLVFTLTPHAVGPWIGEGVIRAGGFPAFFGVAAGYGVLSLLLAMFVRSPAPRADRIPGSSLLALLTRRSVWPVFGTIFLVGSSFGAVLTFIPTYLKSRGFETVSFFFVTYTVVAVGIRVFLAKISDRWGRRTVILPNLLVMVVVLSLLALARNAALFTAAALLFGMSQGFLHPTLGALVVDRVSAADRGKAFGLFTSLFHLGIFLISSTLGNVASRAGYPWVYWISAGLALGCAVFFAYFDPSRNVLNSPARGDGRAADGAR
ncbi:MAG: MFS transporter [Nitrospinota bacterium]